MKKSFLRRQMQMLVSIVLSCTLLVQPVAAMAETDRQSGRDVKSPGAAYAEDAVIVKFKPGVREAVKGKIKESFGLKTEKRFLTGAELLKMKKKAKIEDVVSKLRKDKDVAYAEPDYLWEADSVPNDYDFGKLWGLDNASDNDIDAPEAWDITLGSPNIVVAVIDEGVDIHHPDIASNIWVNPGEIPNDGIDNDGNGYTDDVNGWDFYHYDNSIFDPADGDDHGTHVAGTIAAVADNSIGVAGVSPGVKIMPVKFLGPYGGYTSDAVSAIEYAGKMGARIASNSWGGTSYSLALMDAINSFQGVFIAAAGNAGVDTDIYPHYPSAYECSNLLSVAAIDNGGGMAYFSNYGSATVDVGAPGVDIYSLAPGSAYQWMSGTSMATPHVAGVTALMMSINGSLFPEQVIDIIKQTCAPLASLQGKTVTGGLVNAFQAVSMVKGDGPFVMDTDPAYGEAQVPLDRIITIRFSENIQPGDQFSGIVLKAGSTPVDYSFSIEGSVLTILPSNLQNDMNYTLEIPAGAVKNIENHGLNLAYILPFTTPDTLAPAVTGTSPSDGAQDVELYQAITVQFSEEIKQGANFGSITVNDSPVDAGQSSAYISGSRLYIYPGNIGEYNTLYRVSIPAGAVTDTRGNAFAAPCVFSFTTAADTVPPEIYYSDPMQDAVDVSLSKVITIHFYEEILAGETFDGIHASSGNMEAAISKRIEGSDLVLQPVNKLAPNTSYTVTLPAGAVKDKNGNLLPGPFVLNFTTGIYDIVEFPFRAEDAVADPVKPVLYMLNVPEGKLQVYNYETGASAEVNLDCIPVSIDIGKGQYSDELYVALSSRVPKPYSSSEAHPRSIAVIDKESLQVKDYISIDIEPFDLVAGRDGYLYVTSELDQWTYIKSFSREEKTIRDMASIRQMSFAKLHPVFDRIYTIDTDLSPRDFRAYNISQGLFTDPHYPGGYDSPYHGDYTLNTNFAIDPTGRYIFNGSGHIFACAQDRAQDMIHAGKLNKGFTDIAFEPDLSYFYTLPADSAAVNIYSGIGFGFSEALQLRAPGSFLFRMGNRLVVLGDAAPSSGRYGTDLQVIDLPDRAPAITGTDPLDQAANVPVDRTITITFSENVTPGSAFDIIELKDANGGLVPVTVSITGNRMTVQPQVLMKYNTSYVFTVPAGAVTDSAGNSLAAAYSLNFRTMLPPDTFPPAVVTADPADGTVNVPVNSVIRIIFSENVLQGGSYNSISLKDQNNNPVSLTKNLAGSTLTITPVMLKYSTSYTLTLPAGSVKDAAGNPLVNTTVMTFSTVEPPDMTAPTVISSTPAGGQTNVPIGSSITLNFSENIVTGNMYEGITLKDGSGNVVSFTKNLNGSTLGIQPQALNYNTSYTLTVPAGAVKDAAGNLLAQPYTVTFSTQMPPDTTAPVITGTSPSAGAADVSRYAAITISFSENIQLGGNANQITLKRGSTAAAFTVQTSGNQLILTPNAALATKSTFTVYIPSGAVTDAAGNQLGTFYTFSFTTERK
jgi:subtilisin family serine protease